MLTSKTNAVAVALCTFIFISSAAQARHTPSKKRTGYIRSHYSKFEYRIAMRDGARLFTAVYLPNDRTKKVPIMMLRTPYGAGPYGADRYRASLGSSEAFETSGYIFVIQDVRGRFMSEGEFVNMRPHIARKKTKNDVDESSDTYDTISWLLKNIPRHNGRVGMVGTSYPGFYASAGAIDGHPALKAVSPQAPIADWYWDDMHHHGAFVLNLAFNFFSGFGVPRKGLTTNWPERFQFGTPDGYQFFLDMGPLKNVNEKYFKGKIPFWEKTRQHPNYDSFWQSRNILPHLKNIRAAVLVVGGLYDSEDLYGPLKTYAQIEKQNPRANNRLVMGPWTHGGWHRFKGEKVGDSEFGFPTSLYFQKEVEFPFFEHHLKGKRKPQLPEALIFETGANRWRHFKTWPPKETLPKHYYLADKGRLSSKASEGSRNDNDAFVSDPQKPVPYTMKIGTRWSRTYMGEDQRFAARRPDVLVYQTEPLEQDLTIAGPIKAELFVSTDQSAADWVVKVVDVYPNQLPGEPKDHVYQGGAQQLLVRGEVFRGRYRESYETPKPFTPNQVAKVSFELLDVLHTFKRGHRLMVHIQSSWFPFIDRNPQHYVPNIFDAEESDFVKATHHVYRSQKYPSHLVLGILGE